MTLSPPIGGPDLAHIETWIFDLDNTLYSARCGLFRQISDRMGGFVARLLGLDAAGAQEVQKRLFRQHGTTLRGLMVEHGIDPRVFLREVHACDLSVVPPAPALEAALAALPGRKFVHTNASSPYAGRVLERLGIAQHFSGIHDIEHAEFLPKPDPTGYHHLLARFDINPKKACMFEDMAVNLTPAAQLGMVTVWVETDELWGRHGADETAIHHRTNDLAGWLAAVPGRKTES